MDANWSVEVLRVLTSTYGGGRADNEAARWGPWERTASPPVIELPLSLAITLWLEPAGTPDRKVLMDVTRADG